MYQVYGKRDTLPNDHIDSRPAPCSKTGVVLIWLNKLSLTTLVVSLAFFFHLQSKLALNGALQPQITPSPTMRPSHRMLLIVQ